MGQMCNAFFIRILYLIVNPSQEVAGRNLRFLLIGCQNVSGEVDQIATDIQRIATGDFSGRTRRVIHQQLLNV